MFKWMHNRKMRKLISSAEEYVADHYQETSRKSDSVKVSREMMDRAFEIYERMKNQQKSSENAAAESEESCQIIQPQVKTKY